MFKGEWNHMDQNPLMQGLLGPLAMGGLGAMMNKKKPMQGAMFGLLGSKLLSPLLAQGLPSLGGLGGFGGGHRQQMPMRKQLPVTPQTEQSQQGYPNNVYHFNTIDDMPANFKPPTYSQIRIGKGF